MRRLLIVLVLLAVVGGGFVFYNLSRPFSGFQGEAFVDIPSGMPTRAIARALKDAGVIQSEWQFLVVRAINQKARLQAGEYRFATAASVWTVFNRIARGDIFYREVLIPEGSNMFDIAAAFERAGNIQAKEFLKVAGSPSLVKDLAPGAPSLEGFLFPAVYRVTKHTTAQQVAKEMTDRFRRAWKEIGHTEQDVLKTVTLASLVEKETGVPSERPMVASVFRNRLTRGMTLDCDPTTIYAALLENRYRGTIYRSDLDNTHAYNTYRHPGLPPGPIANPGILSLKAALEPAPTEYLFFVAKADGSGGHNFSATMAEHEEAVRAYRRAQNR